MGGTQVPKKSSSKIFCKIGNKKSNTKKIAQLKKVTCSWELIHLRYLHLITPHPWTSHPLKNPFLFFSYYSAYSKINARQMA